MAIAVGIFLVAAVLLAVALFSAGLIDGMSSPVPDAPPGLADGPVTPEGLRGVRLPVALRGYRMADVDELIERAAAELAAGRSDTVAAVSTKAVAIPTDPPTPGPRPKPTPWPVTGYVPAPMPDHAPRLSLEKPPDG